MQARTLSGTALEAAESSLAKAQSCLILARACHSAGLKEASQYYSRVCLSNPDAAAYEKKETTCCQIANCLA